MYPCYVAFCTILCTNQYLQSTYCMILIINDYLFHRKKEKNDKWNEEVTKWRIKWACQYYMSLCVLKFTRLLVCLGGKFNHFFIHTLNYQSFLFIDNFTNDTIFSFEVGLYFTLYIWLHQIPCNFHFMYWKPISWNHTWLLDAQFYLILLIYIALRLFSFCVGHDIVTTHYIYISFTLV